MTAIDAIAGSGQIAPAVAAPEAAQTTDASAAFSDLLSTGLTDLEAKVDRADAMVRAFAVDDSIPIHQVTVALEEARLAVELALQVRTRLVEGYREIMNMQL